MFPLGAQSFRTNERTGYRRRDQCFPLHRDQDLIAGSADRVTQLTSGETGTTLEIVNMMKKSA
jgi:hypothetical protein